MAYAGARFVNNLVRAMQGEKNIVEAAYVQCDLIPGLSYFATNVTLGVLFSRLLYSTQQEIIEKSRIHHDQEK